MGGVTTVLHDRAQWNVYVSNKGHNPPNSQKKWPNFRMPFNTGCPGQQMSLPICTPHQLQRHCLGCPFQDKEELGALLPQRHPKYKSKSVTAVSIGSKATIKVSLGYPLSSLLFQLTDHGQALLDTQDTQFLLHRKGSINSQLPCRP